MWNFKPNFSTFLIFFKIILLIWRHEIEGTSLSVNDIDIGCGSPPILKHGEFRIINHSRTGSSDISNLSSEPLHIETNLLFSEIMSNQNSVSYLQGSVIEYICDEGFWIHPSGSSRKTCRSGSWFGSASYCVAKGCLSPSEVMNGYYLELSQSSDNLYPPGSTLQFVCHSGYSLKGPDIFVCTDNGKWSPVAKPFCIPSPQILDIRKCALPPNVWGTSQKLIRGAIGGGASVHGTVVEYRCRSGFRNALAPCVAHSFTCREGEWKGNSPQCEEFTSCNAPPTITNGFVYEVSSSFPLQSQVYYTCQTGYELFGPSFLTCEDNGCWTPSLPPRCQRTRRALSGKISLDKNSLSIRTMFVAVISGTIAVFFLLLALLLYHRMLGPKLLRLQNNVNELEATPSTCRTNEQTQANHDPDRVALIAFSDQMVSGRGICVPPTYEEAVRQQPSVPVEHAAGRLVPHSHRNRAHRVVVSGIRRSRHRDTPDNISYQSIGSARQSSSASRSMSIRSWSTNESLGGSVDTVAVSDSTNVTLDTVSSCTGTTGSGVSCRALAGSRASFDTSSLINSEDAPLLEEDGEDCRNEDDTFSLSTRGDADSLKDNVSYSRSVTISLQE